MYFVNMRLAAGRPKVVWHSTLLNDKTRVNTRNKQNTWFVYDAGRGRLIYGDNCCYYCTAELWRDKLWGIFALEDQFYKYTVMYQ